MTDAIQEQTAHLLDRYPWRIILFRWFLVALEMGLATYLVLGLRFELALLFIVYGVIAVFFLLPAIRCSRCYYYGKRCNFGWGEWVSKVFPRDSDNAFSSFYGYTILLWPTRIIPMGAGLYTMGLVFGKPNIPILCIFGGYLLVIIIHRRFYRSRACVRCHEKNSCAVYDKRVMLALLEKSEAA
jgi:hypothetical protein